MSVPVGKLRDEAPEHQPAASPSTCQRGHGPGRAQRCLAEGVSIGVYGSSLSSVNHRMPSNAKANFVFDA